MQTSCTHAHTPTWRLLFMHQQPHLHHPPSVRHPLVQDVTELPDGMNAGEGVSQVVQCHTSCTVHVPTQGSDRTAVIALVATETSRLASWSRLEGLLLHWAVSEGAGATWNSPPAGWSAAPAKGRDAGAFGCTSRAPGGNVCVMK